MLTNGYYDRGEIISVEYVYWFFFLGWYIFPRTLRLKQSNWMLQEHRLTAAPYQVQEIKLTVLCRNMPIHYIIHGNMINWAWNWQMRGSCVWIKPYLTSVERKVRKQHAKKQHQGAIWENVPATLPIVRPTTKPYTIGLWVLCAQIRSISWDQLILFTPSKPCVQRHLYNANLQQRKWERVQWYRMNEITNHMLREVLFCSHDREKL